MTPDKVRVGSESSDDEKYSIHGNCNFGSDGGKSMDSAQPTTAIHFLFPETAVAAMEHHSMDSVQPNHHGLRHHRQSFPIHENCSIQQRRRLDSVQPITLGYVITAIHLLFTETAGFSNDGGKEHGQRHSFPIHGNCSIQQRRRQRSWRACSQSSLVTSSPPFISYSLHSAR